MTSNAKSRGAPHTVERGDLLPDHATGQLGEWQQDIMSFNTTALWHRRRKLSLDHCIFLTLQQPVQNPCVVSNTMLISAVQAEEKSVAVLPGHWVCKVPIILIDFPSKLLIPEDEDHHSLSGTNYEEGDSQVIENEFRLSKSEHSGPDPGKHLNTCLCFIHVEPMGLKVLCKLKHIPHQGQCHFREV